MGTFVSRLNCYGYVNVSSVQAPAEMDPSHFATSAWPSVQGREMQNKLYMVWRPKLRISLDAAW